jgi:tRNA (guanine37-N1)-methyltransferase
MTITLLTLFPHFFDGALQTSVLGRAISDQTVSLNVVNIRDYTEDKHHVTDDRPYGGGAGMVLKVDPIYKALMAQPGYRQSNSLTVLLSARGSLFTQQVAQDYTKLETLFIICGHYEGVDERVSQHLVDVELRVGDYVLTGGEPAALIVADAVTRLLPGTLGNETSLEGETNVVLGRGGYPQYTRPPVFNTWAVPEVLQTGDHAAIEAWREEHRWLAPAPHVENNNS